MTLMRLQKYIAEAGICSRRQAEKDIAAGLVKVNGAVVSELGTKIEPDDDIVEYNERIVSVQDKLVYIALNKPERYVTACKDKWNKTILEFINIKERVYPIGRLDKDSCGLLLLTNDGAIHHKLLHPSFDHEKEYEVTVQKPISDSELLKMENGIFIADSETRPAKTERLTKNSFRIILKEGKNRQIRRMIEKLDNNVVKLKRIKFAAILLKELKAGEWRYLTEKEKKSLKACF